MLWASKKSLTLRKTRGSQSPRTSMSSPWNGHETREWQSCLQVDPVPRNPGMWPTCCRPPAWSGRRTIVHPEPHLRTFLPDENCNVLFEHFISCEICKHYVDIFWNGVSKNKFDFWLVYICNFSHLCRRQVHPIYSYSKQKRKVKCCTAVPESCRCCAVIDSVLELGFDLDQLVLSNTIISLWVNVTTAIILTLIFRLRYRDNVAKWCAI